MSSILKIKAKAIIFRVLICLALLGGGLAALLILAGMRQAPAEIRIIEPALPVRVIKAVREDVRVWITGYGRAHCLNAVSLSPEVSGRVVRVHPRLEPGEVIAAGEILFEIDPRIFKARQKQTEASVAKQESLLERLTLELTHSRLRLETLQRNMALAAKELKRYQTLAVTHNAASASRVDQAEQAYNLARDQARQLDQLVRTYPLQIREAQSLLSSLQAEDDLARLNLEYCRVQAPFKARLKEVKIEAGQFLTAGQPVLTLADDSVLEIQARLDCRDARLWLRFDGDDQPEDNAWFKRLANPDCLIRWVEAPDHAFSGRLDRVVEYDASTRTLTAAVRIEAGEAFSKDPAALPLVEGMFCRVEIPGRTLEGVFRVPESVVTTDGSVYLARRDRLETRTVKVAKYQGDEALIVSGLNQGELIITTRLVNPLENSKLIIEPRE